MAMEGAVEGRAARNGDEDVDLVWWLVRLGQEDRETYRKLRDLAWQLVVANVDSSALPNKLS
jgi:hypothetical protein